ncbi:MAG: peptidylprolyl isomerase [candidate division KSB1 bacterium]|nr:peptidylprolyl isomerase [candidate division KSB1 bacterium]
MRYFFSLVVLSVVLIMACGGQKNPGPLYEPGTEEYALFETLSDSMGIEVLDPDQNKVLITTSEFTIWTSDILSSLYAPLSRMANQINQIPPEQIYQFIEQSAENKARQKLIVMDAKKEGITVSDSAVQAQLESYYQARGGKDQFLQFLEQRNISLDLVKQDIKANLYLQRYTDEVVSQGMEITEEQLFEEYQKPKTASVRHILFSTQGKSEEEKAEIEEKANKVLEEAKSGADFAELAQQYSEDPGSKEKGGLYEDFGKGQMVKPFEEAAFTMDVGEIDLVETRFGYHIIKVVGHKQEEKPFEQVKDSIKTRMEQQSSQDARESAIDQLKEDYNYKEHFSWNA